MNVRFEVLGPLRVHNGGDAAGVAGTLRRTLLAVLLARANDAVPAELLAEELWGSGRDDTLRRLHVQVHRLRGVFDEPGRLSHDGIGYRLRVDPGELDSARFDRLVQDAEECGPHQPDRATELLRTALGLWRGKPYEGVDLPGLAGEVQRLTERKLVAYEALYEAELRCGRHAAVVGELASLVREHPLRERLHALRMTALYQGGRRADALAAYRQARTVLVDELGLEPGPELRALEQRVLGDDPTPPDTPRVVPAQLPHNVSGFVGRAAELSELDDLLAARSVVVSTVVGSAGVGKTSLAVRWAHGVKDRFPDGQLYVDLRGYGPDQPVASADALASFLRALGMDGTAVPHDPAERAARFRTLVDRKRLLIVLDNAHSAGQARPLLPGTASCVVIVTSRDSLAGLVAGEGAHRIELDRMTADEASQLLDELLDDHRTTEREAVTQLVDRCARLPLALRIAAERLRERPHHQVAELVAELDDEHARLDLLDSGDQQTSVRAVFAASYRHLDPATARLFRLFGVHPGHHVDADALAALAGADVHTTRRLLETLTRANLVDETSRARYVMHDLLRTYAAELAESTDPWTDRQQAMTRLLDHYLTTASMAANLVFPHELADPGAESTAIPGYDAAIQWLDTERVNLLRTADVAPDWHQPTYLSDLSTVLPWYLDVGGHLDEARHLHTRALAVARDLGDPLAEGSALRGLGLVDFRLQRYPESIAAVESALALHESAGTAVYQALTLNCLGVLYGLVGRVDDAMDHMRRSVRLYRQIDHRLLTVRSLTSLGLLHRRHGQYEPALDCLREAFAIAEARDHPIEQAHAAYGLAGLYRDAARYPEALEYALQTVRLARRARFRFLEGLALHRLGVIHLRRGDHASAQHHLREALVIARTTGNTQLEAMALNASAETHAAGGAAAEAIRCFRDALSVAADRGAEYEQARAHDGLGDTHEGLGERDRAIEHWQRALALYRPLQAPATTTIEAKLARST